MVITFRQFLDGVEVHFEENKTVVEVNGHPHVFSEDDFQEESRKYQKALIKLAEERGHIVFYDVTITSGDEYYGDGRKAFYSYEDAVEYEKKMEKEKDVYSKGISARILH